MWGVLWLLTIVAMPEALVMTCAIMLLIVVSALMNAPVPTEIFVQSPEKQQVIERNSLKGVKFTADGKMTVDADKPPNSSSLNPNSTPQR